ncbi:FkbM family methyltransferase [Bosea sp. 124]|uniref:FkbM family methyltransferase n=1 Tax=Bosea sp. 124 TaxID=2135642 RepID=UPI000D3BC29C|nr:FkbM family methyltransferase [Bosea sp. 124]PTM41760.1 FkbM family methyltransferase [Bosea sp. 124]
MIKIERIRHLPRQLRSIVQHPLNRNQRIRALHGWLRWQIGSRLGSGPKRVRLAGQTEMVVEPGMTGATGNIYYGLAEWEEMAFLLHALRPDDVFVDIGANVGVYTLLASGVAGASTVAAEPVRSSYDRLVRNIAHNGLQDRVLADRVGISSHRGVLRFTSTHDTTNRIVGADEQVADVEECPVDTVDGWLKNVAPTLIKIDVEGHDREVMSGCHSILKSSNLRALIVETWFADDRTINALPSAAMILHSHGFKPYCYDPAARQINPLTHQTGANVIYIRDLDFIRNRIAGAARVELSHGRSV